MSEALEKGIKLVHEFEKLVAGTDVTYIVSVGKDNTFTSCSGATDTTQMMSCIASIMATTGEHFMRNDFELHHFAKLLDEAAKMAFEKLKVKPPEGKLIVGPWGKEG